MSKFISFIKELNLPNKLTLLRIVLVPVYLVLLAFGLDWPALIVFAAASLTDLFDGKIARKYNLITNFGKFMDPIADIILKEISSEYSLEGLMLKLKLLYFGHLM